MIGFVSDFRLSILQVSGDVVVFQIPGLRHFLSVLRTSSSSVPPGMWIPIPAYPVHNHTDSVQVRIDTHTRTVNKSDRFAQMRSEPQPHLERIQFA